MRTDQSSGKVDLTAISNRAQILYTMISFVKTGGNGKALLKPEILIKLYNRRILDANGKVENNALRFINDPFPETSFSRALS